MEPSACSALGVASVAGMPLELAGAEEGAWKSQGSMEDEGAVEVEAPVCKTKKVRLTKYPTKRKGQKKKMNVVGENLVKETSAFFNRQGITTLGKKVPHKALAEVLQKSRQTGIVDIFGPDEVGTAKLLKI